MKQSGHLNPSEKMGAGCPVASKYGRTTPSKHGGVGRQQHIIDAQMSGNTRGCSGEGGESSKMIRVIKTGRGWKPHVDGDKSK